MKPLSWFPEPVPDWGSFTAQGLRGLLGRPKLHPLAILVRETAQNSWDARLPRRTVKFEISGFQFAQNQQETLSENVFPNTPSNGLELGKRLKAKPLCALIIRDTNTKGLGGPVRASAAKEGHANRWVSFLLDIGVTERAQIDGGTYGFGRSIAYNVSAVNTVLIYTRTHDELDSVESRLIGSALGSPYAKSGRRYTGRHWWGRNVRNSIEPLTGRQADSLAASIGFEPFDADETGTAVMILDPILRTDNPEEAMHFIAESMTWHLWPKMVAQGGRKPMEFEVRWNGSNVSIPQPTKLQPLPAFVRALQTARKTPPEGTTSDGIAVTKVVCQRPNTTLGTLTVSKSAYTTATHQSASLTDDETEESTYASPFSGQSHHVVLLRKPELVVTYREGPLLPDGELQWSGVFLAAPDHNEAFARAEPPTHDCWEAGTVEDKLQRRFVNVALREIDRCLNRLYQAPAPSTTGGSESVARIANALGPLLVGVPGQGGGVVIKNGGSGRSGAGNRRTHGGPKIEIYAAGPVLHKGKVASELRFTVIPGSGSPVSFAQANVYVVIGEGGVYEGEKNRPVGATSPEFLLLEGPPSTTVATPEGRTLKSVAGKQIIDMVIDSADETSWRMLAKAPGETAIAFNVEASSAIIESVDE